MSEQKINTHRQVIASLWLTFFLCAGSLSGSERGEPARGVLELRCDVTSHRTPIISLSVVVRNERPTKAGTHLTVLGFQEGKSTILLTPSGGLVVSPPPGQGTIERTFFHSPSSAGAIEWRVTADGATASCVTEVLATEAPLHVGTDPPTRDQGFDTGGPSLSDSESVGNRDGDGDNIPALHDRNSSLYEDECLECHSEILSRQSLDPTIHPAHLTMQPFIPGEEEEDTCVFCHRGVDLVQGTQRIERSTGNLRRHVDVAVCTLCHAPGRSGGSVIQLYQETLFPPNNPDGPRLYTVLCAGCHGDLGDSEVEGKSAQEIQEEIEEDEGGMGPLDVLTFGEIEAIAAALEEGDR